MAIKLKRKFVEILKMRVYSIFTFVPLAKAKPDGDFQKTDRSEFVLEAFFSNFKRQYDNPSDIRFYRRRNWYDRAVW